MESSSLSEDQAKVCEGRWSQDECFTALKGIAPNKAPGSDGLPMEFYVKFRHVLGADLVLTLNSFFHSAGVLSPSLSKREIAWTRKTGV